MHAVERRRLGRADVRTDVLDRVVAERDELAVGPEPGLDMGHASARRGARGEVLQPVLDPAHRDAELPRGEAHEDDGGEHRRLDPEGPARVGRRDQAQLGAGQPERRGGDRVQRERALEVRPGGERALGGVPVRDDAVALDGRAAPAWEAEALADDEVGACQRTVDVAVVERAVGDARVGLGSRFRVEDGVERLVLDLDQLEGVLREVAVPRDHHGNRLAHVAHELVRGRVVGDRRVDAGRKGP